MVIFFYFVFTYSSVFDKDYVRFKKINNSTLASSAMEIIKRKFSAQLPFYFENVRVLKIWDQQETAQLCKKVGGFFVVVVVINANSLSRLNLFSFFFTEEFLCSSSVFSNAVQSSAFLFYFFQYKYLRNFAKENMDFIILCLNTILKQLHLEVEMFFFF